MHYIITDIHNDNRRFTELLQKINLTEKDHLYLLGDLFDRCEDHADPVGVYFQMLGLGEQCTVIRGNHDHWLANYIFRYYGRELMTQDEIAVMDGGKCILQLRGVRPFLSDKYDITKHPNYKYLSDFDKKNAFDVERYMSTRPAIVKPDEAFDIYEIDLSDEDAAAEE